MKGVLGAFAAPSRAFISYARSDGAELALSLRERLRRECPDVTLWLDRAEMYGGVGWWRQITEALDQVEILIMILTPAAIRSEVAVREWRYARQQGVRVCPVLSREDGFDFAGLPGWMRKVHCYDLTHEWDTFVGYLRSAGKDVRVPFMAPELTDRHVEREEVLRTVLSHVLDTATEGARAAVAALHGPGGFGKTTLATALCLHDDVIDAFDDGILWARLGESPNVKGELTKLYGALTGDRPSFVDIDDASIQLAERLEQKSCLLVVDDVWDANHLKPFMRGARRCVRLFTTRQMSIAADFAGTRLTLVDRMNETQALRMLADRLEPPVENTDALRALADRLGEWPLLLKLAGSQLERRVRRGDSVEGAIAFVGRALERRGVVAFDPAAPGSRGDAIASTVEASLELFSAEDRARCAMLAVLHGDFPFPLAAAGALWNLDEFDTEELLMRLDDAALLEFELGTGVVRLHHVLRTYLESRLDDRPAISSALASAWLREPYELPDVYAWTWIGWHLAQAGEHARLRDLLLDFRWLRSRIAMIPLEAVLEDFDTVRDLRDVRELGNALRLASNGLAVDPDQLGNQLGGRIGRGRSRDIDRLLDDAGKARDTPRLVLVGTSLTHPGGALTGILKAHTGTVTSVEVSPDGSHLASASEDWSLRLWDLRGNRVVRAFEGHTGAVHAVTFTKDGRRLLSGSEDQSLRLWDVGTGDECRRLSGHTLGVRAVAIASGGDRAASVSEDGSARVWDLVHPRTRVLHKGSYHQLDAVLFTADERELIFGAGDATIRIVALDGAGDERVLAGHRGVVRALALTPDGTGLVSGGDDGVVIVWCLRRAEPLFELIGHDDGVDAVAVSPDGRHVVSGARDKTLRVWNLESGAAVRTLSGHAGSVKTVAVARTNRFVSGSSDRSIRRWSLDSAEEDRSPTSHTEAVSLLSMSADGARLASGTRNGELHVRDARHEDPRPARHEPARLELSASLTDRFGGRGARIDALQMAGDGRFVVAGTRDGRLLIWDTDDRTCRQVSEARGGEILELHCSRDGARVVSFGGDRTVRVRDSVSGQITHALVSSDNERSMSALRVSDPMLAELGVGPEVSVVAKPIPRDSTIALSPDGDRVVVASPGSVCSWDLRDGSVRSREHDDLQIATVAFDERSRVAVMGSIFGPLLVWDFELDPVVLTGHTERIVDVLVSADGGSVTSAARDDSIRVWDLRRMRETACARGRLGDVDAVAIVADGTLAYSVRGDTLVAHDLRLPRPLASLSFDHRVTGLAVSSRGDRIAVGDESGGVHRLCLRA